MNTVLVYGRDPRLLETRQWLLEAEGYHVLPISGIAQIKSIAPPVDLLVVCHTVPSDECDLVLELASARWPGAHKLILVARTETPSCAAKAESFHTIEGPAKLVSLVHQLLPPNQPRAASANTA